MSSKKQKGLNSWKLSHFYDNNNHIIVRSLTFSSIIIFLSLWRPIYSIHLKQMLTEPALISSSFWYFALMLNITDKMEKYNWKSWGAAVSLVSHLFTKCKKMKKITFFF